MEVAQQESTPWEEPYFLKPHFFFLPSSSVASLSVPNHAWLLLDSLPVILLSCLRHVLLRDIDNDGIVM
ncbi:hypothetical protein EUGRSUZ_K00738 [Eucalyptus grandis]|uniref:Uncharacterized protein n=2 Tax=Eucalyptus grandis TaxID=71139 RepID=A0A058ZZQ3_EUCGR|nr:hypothetical protein EUGRSUZ_K00738 [Eucalyptus grandis]